MRWKREPRSKSDSPEGKDSALIDARELVLRYSTDELSVTADEYFARVTDPWYHTVKPFASPEEAPDNLGSFGALIVAAELKKSHAVLDFAAGSCWTSRYLAQMGCDVVASDISPSALDIGRQSLAALPLLPPHGHLEFLNFDGFTVALAAESVDRVVCLDAFHHVVN
jgi:2-polyprenyl-3-methyl-5-hydroxy-6-metoxy-1,4-benzoquinol methylase